jgi:subtilisin family serine protease
MSDEYIILRRLDEPRRSSGNVEVAYRGPVGAPRRLGRTPTELNARSRRTFGMDVSAAPAREALDALRDPKVEAVARRMPMKLMRPLAKAPAPARLAAGAMWNLDAVGATESRFTGKGTVVAVLDTGIDRAHDAFKGVTLVEKDFTGDGDGDTDGHGTHCAGTIFGREVRGKRIGVAPGVEKALIGKVLRADGGGDSKMIFQAIQWAVQSNCDVISMSLGFDFPGMVDDFVKNEGWPIDRATSEALVAFTNNLRVFDSLTDQVRLMAPFDSGAVIVAAAGNESHGQGANGYRLAASLPAAARGVFSVGALRKSGAKYAVADFSNTLPRLSAPGVGILSAEANTTSKLVAMDGTSMACPHVAGVAALWWQAMREANDGQTSAQRVEAQLLSSVRSDVFTAGTQPVDRGDGLVTAPR